MADLSYNSPDAISFSERDHLRSILDCVKIPSAIGPIVTSFDSAHFNKYGTAFADIKDGIYNLYYLGISNESGQLNFDGNQFLTGIDFSLTAASKINARNLPNLEDFRCIGCPPLTELNIQGSTKLNTLYCHSCSLTELNIQGLTGLKDLICENNNFSAPANDAILVALSEHGTPSGFAQLSLPTGASGAAARDYLVNSLQWIVVIT